MSSNFGAREQLLGAGEVRAVIHQTADADDAGARLCRKGRDHSARMRERLC